MKKLIYWLIISILFSMFCINGVFAYSNVQVNLSSDKNTIKKGEEIEIVLSMQNAKTAAFTAYVYFDNSYLEYVKGPKMSNLDNNRIIYVWYDENGIGESKDGELGQFTFKAKKDGVSSFSVNGEFYDEDGDVIKANFKDLEIRIGKEQNEATEAKVNPINEEVDKSKNTNLETLAVENVLLYPPFDNNVTSYNFEVPNNVKVLNILAVPENEKAKVKINGGSNLKKGNNTIIITVIAEDGKTKKVVKLNAYRRAQREEQAYLQDKEENQNNLEEIYNKEQTSSEIVEEEFMEETNEELGGNGRNQRKKACRIAIIALGMICIIGVIVFWYKKSYKK